jgi:Flp pilus assembly pilin Flp
MLCNRAFREEQVMQSPEAVDTLLKVADQQVPPSEEGQDLMEYGLLAALIAIVAIGAVSALGQTIYTLFWKTIENTSF